GQTGCVTAKRLLPRALAARPVAAPAPGWGAPVGIAAPAVPIPTASHGGTAYGGVPLPAHPPKRRKARRRPAAPVAPAAPGTLAVLTGSSARAPRGAPAAVALAIAAANQLQGLPYRFGGGHAAFKDSAYDCSGTVSYMLHGAGLLGSPLDSTGLMSFGLPG